MPELVVPEMVVVQVAQVVQAGVQFEVVVERLQQFATRVQVHLHE